MAGRVKKHKHNKMDRNNKKINNIKDGHKSSTREMCVCDHTES